MFVVLLIYVAYVYDSTGSLHLQYSINDCFAARCASDLSLLVMIAFSNQFQEIPFETHVVFGRQENSIRLSC